MAEQDLHVLPKVRDSWSYLYVEHAKIDQEDKAIAVHDAEQGRVPVPCASLSALLLGPGTTITHAAMRALADSGCSVVWVGEEGVRTYAQGIGETRSSRNLLRQATLCVNPGRRLEVVSRMYRMRFTDPLEPGLTLQQIRGREGIRVREAYARASRETGVAWSGRSYDRGAWSAADPINRALSTVNACLYGISHAAIVSAGFSPGLGFIHTGKSLSFVYDVADFYKVALGVPIAFAAVRDGSEDLERRVRRACREAFHQQRLLGRVVADIERALFGRAESDGGPDLIVDLDIDAALPGDLWGGTSYARGGVNYASEDGSWF